MSDETYQVDRREANEHATPRFARKMDFRGARKRGAKMRRLLGIAFLGLISSATQAAEPQAWEGWIVGAPCADTLRVADCPLRYVDRPVLLLENGQKQAFLSGEGKAISADEVDKAYAKKVRLTGEVKEGMLHPVKLDLLEVSGERKFFKGCL